MLGEESVRSKTTGCSGLPSFSAHAASNGSYTASRNRNKEKEKTDRREREKEERKDTLNLLEKKYCTK
jgi:hypothetical protein